MLEIEGREQEDIQSCIFNMFYFNHGISGMSYDMTSQEGNFSKVMSLHCMSLVLG